MKRTTLLMLMPFGNNKMKFTLVYDLLPTNSGQCFQEFASGKYGKDSTSVNVMTECEAFGLSKEEVANEVMRVIEVVNTWQTHLPQIGVCQ
jgi:serine/threonine-protein kinase HipA